MEKGNILVTIILVVLLTLIVIFIFFGDRISAGKDFSIDSLDSNNDVLQSSAFPKSDSNAFLEIKANISLEEMHLSDKNIIFDNNIEIKSEDSVIKSNKLKLLYFTGDIMKDSNQWILKGSIKGIITEDFSANYSKKKEIYTKTDSFIVKNAELTIEKGSTVAELSIKGISDFNIFNSYLKIKNYRGDIVFKDKVALDGNAGEIKMIIDGKELIFK